MVEDANRDGTRMHGDVVPLSPVAPPPGGLGGYIRIWPPGRRRKESHYSSARTVLAMIVV